MYKIDAHNSSVLSVAVHESFLISSATKNIRIWDLENKKLISDLTGPQLNGSVKFILVDPIRSLLFTACEKTVTMWDLVTL
jgi:WD40 repeat protein